MSGISRVETVKVVAKICISHSSLFCIPSSVQNPYVEFDSIVSPIADDIAGTATDHTHHRQPLRIPVHRHDSLIIDAAEWNVNRRRKDRPK